MKIEKKANYQSSIKLFLLLIILPAGIFISEVIAMILIQFYKGPYRVTTLLDAFITTILMFPLIYILSYRPLLKHIFEQDQAESIMQARLRLIQFAIDHTIEELLQETLDEIEILTGSKIGFFHYLDADQKKIWLQAWSTNTLQNMCKADKKDSLPPANVPLEMQTIFMGVCPASDR